MAAYKRLDENGLLYFAQKLKIEIDDIVDSVPTPPTYTLSINANIITLTGTDGSTTSIALPVYNGSVSSS